MAQLFDTFFCVIFMCVWPNLVKSWGKTTYTYYQPILGICLKLCMFACQLACSQRTSFIHSHT